MRTFTLKEFMFARRLSYLIVLIAIFSLIQTATAQSNSVTLVSSSISQPNITAGQIQTVKASLRPNVSVSNAIIHIRIYNSSRVQVAVKAYDNIALTNGVTANLQFDYQTQATTTPGSYTVEIGVWNSSWATLLYQGGLTPFEIVAPPVQTKVTLVSATVSKSTLTAGDVQNSRVTVHSASNVQDAIAHIRIYDSSRVQVATKAYDKINFPAGNTVLEFNYQPPSTQTPGNYTVEVGVWKSNWETLLYEGGLTPFSIVAPAPVVTGPAFSLESATVSHSSIAQGQTQIVKAALKASRAMNDIIIDIRIYNSLKEKVATKSFDMISFTSGQQQTFQYDFQVPSTLATGNYTVEVGVWDLTWTTHLYEGGLAPFTIVASSSAPTPTPTPTPNPDPNPNPNPNPTPSPSPGTMPEKVLATLRNLIINPGFEFDHAGYNFEGWQGWSIDTTQPRSGTKALKISPNGGLATLFLFNQLVPGQSYKATVHAKIANPGETAIWGINVGNAAGVNVVAQSSAINSTEYKAYTIDFTVPLDARNASLYFYKHEGTASIYADDLEVVQTTNVQPLFYVQPSPTPVGGIGYPFGSRRVPYVAGLRPTNVSLAAQDEAIKNLYNGWKGVLSTRCGNYMVVFSQPTKYAAVSEGISYGMLIAAIMGGADPQAKDVFDGLYRFSRAHPAYNIHPDLMDWAISPECGSAGGGWNAVDGDLDIAMALLLADKQWGSAGTINYMAEAIKVINAMKLANFRSDGLVASGRGMHRLSDNMISHFRAFKKATGDTFWDLAITKAFEMLDRAQALSPHGLIPGWVYFEGNNVRPSTGWMIEGPLEGDYDWNSNRIPWRLATDYAVTGDVRSHRIGLKLMTFLRTASGNDPAQIAAGYKLDGTPIWQYPSLSFVGPAAAGALLDTNNQAFMNTIWNHTSGRKLEGYYDNELQILGLIVASGNWWQP